MRVSATILGFVAATSLTLSPAFADPCGTAPAHKPPTSGKPTTSGKPVASTMTHSTGKPTTSGKPATSTMTHSTGKPTTVGKPTKSTSAKPTATTAGATTSGSRSKHAATTSTTTRSGSTAPLNPIAAKIASKPNLNAKLTGMLPIDPVTGKTMTLNKASLGFKNQGQFIAALHVSQNLGIPFTELKSHMVTVTPGAPGQPPTATQTGSLGQAIQASKTTAGVTTEVERAETQTAADLQSTTSRTSSTTSGSTLPKNKTTKKTATTGGVR
jgi:hypothetical protein